LNSKRYLDESAVGVGAMIMFISSGILACLILAAMVQMAEKTAQTPEMIMSLATSKISDKIIVHDIYVWDEWDNFGIIWELSPGSQPKEGVDLHWILQCTDPTGKYWAFWGDFTATNMDVDPHKYSVKQKINPGLKAEFFDNQGMGTAELPDLTNRIPDITSVEGQIMFAKSGGAWPIQGGNLPWVDEFSLRASGYLDITVDGTYTFNVDADDGYALWVDGQLIVEGVNSASSGDIDLIAGKVPIQIEYHENQGVAGLILRWESAAIPREIIPAARLTHDDNMIDPNTMDFWETVTTFEAGILYEISIDQMNGNAGRNNLGDAVPAPTCGPKQLHENDLKGQLTFIVGGGSSTWTEFKVPGILAGTRVA
jgi:hypothetical protein